MKIDFKKLRKDKKTKLKDLRVSKNYKKKVW